MSSRTLVALVCGIVAWQIGSAAQDRSNVIRIAATGPAEAEGWQPRIAAGLADGSLRLRERLSDPLVRGRQEERLDQYYRGVRVFGGDVARQLQGSNPISTFGTTYTDITIETNARLSVDDAIARMHDLTGVTLGGRRRPELVILPLDTGQYVLTYRARVMSPAGMTLYFLDAQDGHIVRQYSDLKTQSAIGVGTGVLGDQKKISVRIGPGGFVADDKKRPPSLTTYDLRGDLSRTMAFLNNQIDLIESDLSVDPDNNWTDGPTVDAHVYTGYTYDYFFKRFSRRGLDNRDLATRGLVHTVRRSDLTQQPDDVIDTFYLNAFYAGDGIMVYGEGLPAGFVLSFTRQTVDYFSAGLDVVAHELTHGVTDYSSNLIYLNESGALNEAFSDIMGTSVEFFFQTAGSGLRQADYLIGEDVFRPGGIRSLADPEAFGDPDHYSLRFLGTDDNGFVHTNSLIASHAFYLAIEGGTNRTSGLSVQGVGGGNREQIEKVFYRAFTQLMPANSTFAIARAATIQAARDLFGAGSAPERAVTQAWTAVGVN